MYVLYFAVVILEEFVLEEPVACVARKATGPVCGRGPAFTITDNYSSTNRSLEPVVSLVVAVIIDPSTDFVNARSLEFTVDYIVDGCEIKR